MHHKQCSFLGKLSLRWNTVIAACLNCASGTNSNHTILQEAFSDSQGGTPPPPPRIWLVLKCAFHSTTKLIPSVCGRAASSTTCYLTSYFPASPPASYPGVQSCPFLIHLLRPERAWLKTMPFSCLKPNKGSLLSFG